MFTAETTERISTKFGIGIYTMLVDDPVVTITQTELHRFSRKWNFVQKLVLVIS